MGLFLPSGCSPGRVCCGPVISQLTASQGWSHHLVWFKAKLPEWDGRAELFFLAPLPPFSPAQQKNGEREACTHGITPCVCVCVCAGEPLLPALPQPLLMFKPWLCSTKNKHTLLAIKEPFPMLRALAPGLCAGRMRAGCRQAMWDPMSISGCSLSGHTHA